MLLICFFDIVHVDHSQLSLSLIHSEFICNSTSNKIANLYMKFYKIREKNKSVHVYVALLTLERDKSMQPILK